MHACALMYGCRHPCVMCGKQRLIYLFLLLTPSYFIDKSFDGAWSLLFHLHWLLSISSGSAWQHHIAVGLQAHAAAPRFSMDLNPASHGCWAKPITHRTISQGRNNTLSVPQIF